MIPEITLTFTDDQKAQLEQTIQQEIAHQVATILSRLPLPEVMFSFPQAAKLFALHPETLRAYTKLPLRDSRRLRYVDCTGSARGQRITAAELLDWQRRNHADTLQESFFMKVAERRARLATRKEDRKPR
ncbi:hypothetical protein [Hymenobacter psychrotolerans]|uniref:Uncharacterized protein n=1 Tax=Hymenobacter psychrotolerans DSM 18569 TaxID=1121959 RepID=A0A1M6USC4_9BACT|nr:hypothetical protein [Hymenobacter psychrotolerans]SHK72127.1 hypothetical protein SAMN02746009_01461 [Hymenobacter psychrotolerans DSM 18569]